jgi:hypothetical protein
MRTSPVSNSLRSTRDLKHLAASEVQQLPGQIRRTLGEAFEFGNRLTPSDSIRPGFRNSARSHEHRGQMLLKSCATPRPTAPRPPPSATEELPFELAARHVLHAKQHQGWAPTVTNAVDAATGIPGKAGSRRRK